jgi:ribosomal-protein-alanine N-acetyltransferase
MTPITPLTDGKLMAALHKSAFEPSGAAAWEAKAFDGLMHKARARAFGTPDGFIFLQPLEGEADTEPREAEILTLVVKPKARRSGLASRLIVHGAAALGVTRLFLEVAADNEAARALYLKNGFSETGRRKAYYKRADDTRMDAVLMQGDFPSAM